MKTVRINKETNVSHPNRVYLAVAEAISYPTTDDTAVHENMVHISKDFTDTIKAQSYVKINEELAEAIEAGEHLFPDVVKTMGVEAFFEQEAGDRMPAIDSTIVDDEDAWVVKVEDGAFFEEEPKPQDFEAFLRQLFGIGDGED